MERVKKPKKPVGSRRYGLDFAVCWQRAKRRMQEASGVSPDAARAVVEPVARARRLAELAAPANERMVLAYTLGADPRDVEEDKAGARLIVEGARSQLGIVGLRSSDAVEEGTSERMTSFLRAFFDVAGGPSSRPATVTLEATPEARRVPALRAGPAPATETRPNLPARHGAKGCPSA